MIAKLLKISPPRLSRNGLNEYIRVYFETEKGEFAMTDICPAYRNYRNWQEILRAGAGTLIENFEMFGNHINADSRPRIVEKTLFEGQKTLIEALK